MGAISLPFNIQTGDPLDPDPVMANDQAIVSAVNGGLEMGSNVKAAAPSASITGKDNTAGISTSGLRADAQFVLQGVENVTAKPTTGNFLGRMVYITAGGDIGKAFICTNASTPTWKAFANQAAADVTLHAANHTDGGIDQLATLAIAQRNMKSRTIHKATLGSNHTQISNSAFSTIIDLAVDTSGVQTLGVSVTLRYTNGGAQGRNCAFRVVDVTDSNTTIYRSEAVEIPASNVQTAINGFFYYNTPTADPRTLRVQAGTVSGANNDIDVLASASFNGESANPPTIQAVVL